MAKKKTTKKITKKITKKKTTVLPSKSIVIETSILKTVITNFKYAEIEDFVMVADGENKTLWMGGIGAGNTMFCGFKIQGIETGNLIMVFDIKKFEKALKTLKKEVMISTKKGSMANFSSGRIKHRMALQPQAAFDDTIKRLIDLIENIENNENIENYFKCTVDPEEFKDVMLIANNMDFAESLFFEPIPSKESLRFSLLDKSQVDLSEATLNVTDIEIVGEPGINLINPKFIKTFEVFTDPFTLVVPVSDAIRSYQYGKIGSDELDYKVIVMLAVKKEVEEEEVVEEYEETGDTEFEEEPTEEDGEIYEETEEEEEY